ncbi:hypothetical protein RCJ96_25830 [Bacillus sp. BSL6]|uniref:hypothetical protein n=1 Tax=Bacillus TaxID=1386 RepID=UPI003A80AADF
MGRDIYLEIPRVKEIHIIERAIKEELAIITENKLSKHVEVMIEYKNENNEIVKREQNIIKDNHYELLISNSPVFAPGKPEGGFRESDIWYIIDLIRLNK